MSSPKSSPNVITNQAVGFNAFQDFSVQCFNSVEEFTEYAEIVKSKGDANLLSFIDTERNEIDAILQSGRANKYGLRGTNKAPLSYQDALNRNEFVYKEEYEKTKRSVEKMLNSALEKSSLAEAMKSKMIFTERELGEFVYERASMAIKPNLFYYSFIHELSLDEKDVIFTVVDGESKYSYKEDGSEVVLCIKVTYGDDKRDEVSVRYYEASKITDEDLQRISEVEKGVISISSNVKKVYQFKDKQPRIKNAVKVFLGTTVGGFTKTSIWGDFYTGVAAVLITEYLEARDYSVELVMVLGGGRCTGCLSAGYHLDTPSGYGRRYIGITVKKLDEQLDLDRLLYWTADPSALNIKLLRYMNVFHWLYGDRMTNKSNYWHGIKEEDIINPIGSFYKQKDIKEGNKDLMYFFAMAVDGEKAVAQAVLNIVLTCENTNYQINQKALNPF